MTAPFPLPSSEYLRSRLSYNAETGELCWLPKPAPVCSTKLAQSYVTRWNARRAGKPAGVQAGKVRVSIDWRNYLAHRLIWEMVHSEEPDCVDHINGDQTDNRLVNLRNISQALNNRNCKLRRDNQSGCVGVYWDKSRRVWRVYLTDKGKTEYIGAFKALDDAIVARRGRQINHGFTERHGVAA